MFLEMLLILNVISHLSNLHQSKLVGNYRDKIFSKAACTLLIEPQS